MDLSYIAIGYMDPHPSILPVTRNIQLTHLLILSSMSWSVQGISTLKARSREQLLHSVDLVSFNGRIVDCTSFFSCLSL
uniref:Uncharacterized protein n=1 Tax=Lepeophtheirus salmonis TaxID=72036 RepID=A0A0K2U014_LEPSM